MKSQVKLKGIDQTLAGIRIQIADSLNFASHYIGPRNNAYEIWRTLKPNLQYVNDPNDAELLQSFQTLMLNNWHGIPGAGDCDCFTIAATSCFIVSGIPCEIVLAGNTKGEPTHIYNYCKYAGSWIAFDLTEPHFAQERYYRHKQIFRIESF